MNRQGNILVSATCAVALWTTLAACESGGGGDDGYDPGPNGGGAESSFFSEQEDDEEFGPGIYTIEVSMSPSKPNGDDWDAFGGAPDPFIQVGGYSFESQACQDSFFCTFEVSGSGPFAVEVYDSDLSTNDYAGSALCNVGKTCSTNNGGAKVSVY